MVTRRIVSAAALFCLHECFAICLHIMQQRVDKKEKCDKKSTRNIYLLSNSYSSPVFNNYDTYVMQEKSAKTKSSGI